MRICEILGLLSDTYADSKKSSGYIGLQGYGTAQWGKGSICGEYLKRDTLAHMPILREHKPDVHISASGGVFEVEDAKDLLENGANSIQLCNYTLRIPL